MAMATQRGSKIVLIGEANVGKTSIMIQQTQKIFPTNTNILICFPPTSEINVEGKIVKLEMWDTAGQERFRSINRHYYKGSSCCVLVYDITDSKSFESLENWRNEFLMNRAPKNSETFPFVLLGNKIDKESERQVDFAKVQEWCQSNGNMVCLEVSAKTNTMIEEAFVKIAESIAKYPQEDYETVVSKPQAPRDRASYNSCPC